MRIALFSDIHANLPALETLLGEIKKQEVDAIYCLGDLVGYNGWPNEVVDRIRRQQIICIKGNHDERIGELTPGAPYKPNQEHSTGDKNVAATHGLINDSNRRYLKNLPTHLGLRHKTEAHSMNLLMTHASPESISGYLFENHPEEELLQIMQHEDAHVLFIGHTHKPYHRVMEYEIDGEKAYRHVINTGSAGKPKDGDTRTGYLIVNLEEGLSHFDSQSLKVDFYRVAYDIDRACEKIAAEKFPEELAEALQKAK